MSKNFCLFCKSEKELRFSHFDDRGFRYESKVLKCEDCRTRYGYGVERGELEIISYERRLDSPERAGARPVQIRYGTLFVRLEEKL